MAFQLTWSPVARFDLKELYAYIAEDNEVAAERFVEAVFSTVDQLIENPRSGRMVPELCDPDIRELVRSPCRIIYRVIESSEIVEIARIWHGARDKPEL